MMKSAILQTMVTVLLLCLTSAGLADGPKKQGSTATPHYSLNAMCLLKNTKEAQVEPVNLTAAEIKGSKSLALKKTRSLVGSTEIQTKFRIASLSKILVSHWAIHELGPLYRFETRVHVTPTVGSKDGACNIYFEGSQDPFMGKEMLGTVFQQLRMTFKDRKICAKIDSISYDENFLIPFNIWSNRFAFQHREDGNFRAGNPSNFYGPKTTRKALQYYIKSQKIFNVAPEKIGPTSSAADYMAYVKASPHLSYSFKSQPLHMMLRELNSFSFNVPADLIFNKLGGAEAYAQFIQRRLGYGPDHVTVWNGSGYPVTTDVKRYNEVSCSAFVRVVQDLSNILAVTRNGRSFQLADILAAGGESEEYSTFKSFYGESSWTNTMAGKTGSAEESITFGGMLSTSDGELYFAVLAKPFSYTDSITEETRDYVRDMMTAFAKRYTLRSFNYQPQRLMPAIDSESRLKELEVDFSAFENPRLDNKLK